MREKIGVFGGRFDPPHIGHLLAAIDTKERLLLKKIVFLVSYKPPHKKAFAPFTDRLKMTELAVSRYEGFEASGIEEKLTTEKSYTVPVLKELKRMWGNKKIYFIMGEDQFHSIESWYNYKELFEIVEVVVLSRPGESKKRPMIERSLIEKVEFVNQREIEISSSEIRERVRKGLPISFFVPPEVEDYIKKKGLYRE